MAHNKISFAREYCRCRSIPYKVRNEALFVNGRQICFSLLNLNYHSIITMVDAHCHYDEFGHYDGLLDNKF